jgi:hypothetical protein
MLADVWSREGAVREKIFLSYPHKDDKWRDKFKAVVGHGVYARQFELWIDEQRP